MSKNLTIVFYTLFLTCIVLTALIAGRGTDILVNTELIFFWHPSVARWPWDVLMLAGLILSYVALHKDHDHLDLSDSFGRLLCGLGLGLVLSLGLGSFVALVLGLAGAFLCNLRKEIDYKEGFDWLPGLFGGFTNRPGPSYLFGLFLGIGIVDGFLVSLSLGLWFMVLPIVIMFVLLIIFLVAVFGIPGLSGQTKSNEEDQQDAEA